MRVLSIDGGGIRGLIPAIVLAEIERRSGRRIGELFDLIAGTSTGGILAAALCRPDAVPAADLVELYERDGPQIFARTRRHRIATANGLLGERYDRRGLRAALEQRLGAVRLSQCHPELLLTAYELEGRQAFFFRSSRARTDSAHDFALADAAAATSAAPSYFAPMTVADLAGSRSHTLVDGGVFATDPVLCAMAEAAAGGAQADVALSLGTGSHTRPVRLPRTGRGLLGWAPHILDVVFDGVAETVDYEASMLLGPRYVRLQTELGMASDDLDDASAPNLVRLRAEGERLVAERSAGLDDLISRLAAPASGQPAVLVP